MRCGAAACGCFAVTTRSSHHSMLANEKILRLRWHVIVVLEPNLVVCAIVGTFALHNIIMMRVSNAT